MAIGRRVAFRRAQVGRLLDVLPFFPLFSPVRLGVRSLRMLQDRDQLLYGSMPSAGLCRATVVLHR